MRLWREVDEVARTMAPAQEWRQALASRLRTAADASFVSIATCVPGDWRRLHHDADPPELRRVIDRISQEFVPRIEQSGEDWRFALRNHGRVYAPMEVARARKLAEEMRAKVLAPEGIDGYLVGFMTDGARLLGMIAVGAPDGSERLFARSRQLEAITAAASTTLASALALAEACGASAPVAVESALLTSREREIAGLAAEGYSNLNVAARLGIAEATVAVHVRNVYAKLGVHSRIGLSAALRAG